MKVYTLLEYVLGAPPEEEIPGLYELAMTAFRASDPRTMLAGSR
jgi:hypothetical protein